MVVTRSGLRLLEAGLAGTSQIPNAIQAGQTLITDFFQESALRLQEAASSTSSDAMAYLMPYARSLTSTVDDEESSTKNSMRTGYYKGAFKRPRKAPITSEDIYLSLGHYTVREQYGVVTGSDSVYVGSSGFDIDSLSYTITIAMLRKLFLKHGMDIYDPSVSIVENLTSIELNILMLYTDASGNYINPGQYVIPAGASLDFIAANCGIQTTIKNYAIGSIDRILNRLVLRATEVTLAQLNLKNEQIVCEMGSKLNVQNRTKGAAEIGNSTDVVDNQPLKGYLYYFKKGNPRTTQQPNPLNTSRWAEFNYSNDGGVMLVSGGASNVDPTMREPPTPKFFQNCSKSSYVRLEPGCIKTASVKNQVTKYYEDFIRMLAWFNGATGRRSQRVADCCMLGFEEALNSASTNYINLSYEAENRIGVFFKTAKITPIKKHYQLIGPVDAIQPPP